MQMSEQEQGLVKQNRQEERKKKREKRKIFEREEKSLSIFDYF